ncbi:alpha/beta hydrolase [Mycobacterium sp. MYCO198283]|uniref:alpha/beta fold hydrolase n=1 Tax=Mycobacterium sp. MYCO198283 TaxID=2883505 RepID=UPI001E283DD9|nr:alpha/beta hydrolase [Mycobacterium sp. MYCO198283]MCG5431461.1 alpha/beta hydrolase [Mycobacterium sp. MYCO198283]
MQQTERLVDLGNVTLRVVEAGEPGGPVVVLAHGFPELAYSWRHQIPALAAAGYRVLAPDQRGYGGSSIPAEVEAYDIHALTGDLVGLLDDAGAERAAFVGHDWGALVVWQLALLHPERVAAVVGMSVPPIPRPRSRPTEAWRAKLGDDFYMLRFQERGPADQAMAADPTATMHQLFADLSAGIGGASDPDRLPPLPDWITADEVAHYGEVFARTGFTGGLNWYRNYDRNWETTEHLADARIVAPAMFLGGSADPVLLFTRRDRAAEVIGGPYREVLLDGAGHWVQQERPQEVNDALLTFLDETVRSGRNR